MDQTATSSSAAISQPENGPKRSAEWFMFVFKVGGPIEVFWIRFQCRLIRPVSVLTLLGLLVMHRRSGPATGRTLTTGELSTPERVLFHPEPSAGSAGLVSFNCRTGQNPLNPPIIVGVTTCRSTCPYVHPGEKARRRDPRTHSYRPLPCPHDRQVRSRWQELALVHQGSRHHELYLPDCN